MVPHELPVAGRATGFFAAKERKEREDTELNLNADWSGTRPLGERAVVSKILFLRSLRSFAAIHRRFWVHFGIRRLD